MLRYLNFRIETHTKELEALKNQIVGLREAVEVLETNMKS
jgi:hypothetical protein